jgi:hypothetical protein
MSDCITHVVLPSDITVTAQYSKYKTSVEGRQLFISLCFHIWSTHCGISATEKEKKRKILSTQGNMRLGFSVVETERVI